MKRKLMAVLLGGALLVSGCGGMADGKGGAEPPGGRGGKSGHPSGTPSAPALNRNEVLRDVKAAIDSVPGQQRSVPPLGMRPECEADRMVLTRETLTLADVQVVADRLKSSGWADLDMAPIDDPSGGAGFALVREGWLLMVGSSPVPPEYAAEADHYKGFLVVRATGEDCPPASRPPTAGAGN